MSYWEIVYGPKKTTIKFFNLSMYCFRNKKLGETKTHYHFRKHLTEQKSYHLLDEMLNRDPDSVVIKNALLLKSRGVTPVSWPNSLHRPLSIMAS